MAERVKKARVRIRFCPEGYIRFNLDFARGSKPSPPIFDSKITKKSKKNIDCDEIEMTGLANLYTCKNNILVFLASFSREYQNSVFPSTIFSFHGGLLTLKVCPDIEVIFHPLLL